MPSFKLSHVDLYLLEMTFKLWCYSHRYRGDADCPHFSIDGDLSMTVEDCGKLIQPIAHAFLLPSLCLYTLPHPVPLQDIRSTLVKFSVSDLGSPLPPSMTIQQIFQAQPREHHLHFVVVDRGTPLPMKLWIPDKQKLLTVGVTNDQSLSEFLLAVEEKDPTLKGKDITLYKTPYKTREELCCITLDRKLDDLSKPFSAFDDTPFSMTPCITLQVVRPERKHGLPLENAEEYRKRYKAYTVTPFEFNTTLYRSVQRKDDWRIYDFRALQGYTVRLPDADLPPIEILFDGFGRFLEIWRAASAANFKPDFDFNIHEFITTMSQIYDDEKERSKDVLPILNRIFPPNIIRHSIAPAEIHRPRQSGFAAGPSPRTDGISSYRNTIPCILVQLNNEGPTKCTTICELIEYYRFVVVGLCDANKAVVNGSTLQTLGITIVGPSITFYALASARSTVCLPLTPTLWCYPVECGGSDQFQFYAAFKAVTVLIDCIVEEAKQIFDGPGVPIPINPLLPQLHKLRRFQDSSSPAPSQHIEFQITGFLAKDINQHVYLASSSSGSLVFKLTRSYSPELHAFCARLGRAPELYACERLPGGIIAVVMAYVDGTMIAPTLEPALRAKWTTAMRDVVHRMHDKGFVHGDLRAANFWVTRDAGEVVLLDFDWGGRVGETRYPPVCLNPILQQGRATSSLVITKQDDVRVLEDTIRYVCGD